MSIECGRARLRRGTYAVGGGRAATSPGSGPAGDVGGIGLDGDDVAKVVDVAVAERSEDDDERLKDRQACVSRLTALRWGAACASSSSGLTVDLKRMRSHQLGTRCLLLESYTPLSSSVSAVPSPLTEGLGCTRAFSDDADARTSSRG